MNLILSKMDTFTLSLTILCGVVTLGLFSVTAYFCFKFHASKQVRGENVQNRKIEIIWTLATVLIFIGIFLWSTSVYHKKMTPPEKIDYEIFVYAKRWMWKFYHPNGLTEVNTLHLPKGKNIRLKMISKDVIHSFYLPELQVKQDVLPNMYTYLYLTPQTTGEHPLYCAEYCGSQHSGMIGKTEVVVEEDYLDLLKSPQQKGRGPELLTIHSCLKCHNRSQNIAPTFDKMVNQEDSYLREAILNPKKTMPSYRNVLDEEDLHVIIEEIKFRGGKK